ncbi:ATP-grasp domain-containing protein [Ancylobacter sp. 6x-1]|uniref:biotin carboxylase n=1 Tax=Ancylobacter crimeensis TaxID=2579147 RepID=A0ABT0DDT1_9HYPH|nr:biotin carboxylase N-terminal domain-containing protein [Ancylobacter crimeensis]MCK0198133.1 ATP-grasp domain-containing protein [Ancylobacter crimeensis]
MKKVLIANRGEIAVRIIRACRDAGLSPIAIASDADRTALHARLADEVHRLKGTSPIETYLNQAAILDIARQAGADAVHPGYGLLSENESFAAAVTASDLIWIGPSADAIARLGDKVAARAIARRVGAPLLPSLDDGALTLDTARQFIAAHGLPVIVKAQNGGGGRGMRIVRHESELPSQLAAAEREAQIAFGRPECFIERYLENARHIETQCLADRHGHVLIVSTRDCTLQRRQQKIIEEAPAPFLTTIHNERLAAASTAILQDVGYCGAATCEFLLTAEGDIFFLEVNTRIQVEHPVTEEIAGFDLIREMFRIAMGEHLPSTAPRLRGHAVEFRINAEDPYSDFRPRPGRISRLALPGGPGVRLDFGYEAGDTVPPYYDSLIGKIIVHGRDRIEALTRARRALGEFQIEGVATLAPLHRAILSQKEFASGDAAGFAVHTRWIDEHIDALSDAAAAMDRSRGRIATLPGTSDAEMSSAFDDPPAYRIGIKAPLAGTVLELCVCEGQNIAPGDLVAVMESMKMEQSILAETAGVVARINVAPGAFIDADADLVGLD